MRWVWLAVNVIVAVGVLIQSTLDLIKNYEHRLWWWAAMNALIICVMIYAIPFDLRKRFGKPDDPVR